ncbi:TRAP transporter small permease [Chloroflexota bacterium]
MKNWISVVNRNTSAYFAYTGGLVLAAMLFIVLFEVWMRFVQNNPISWAIEVPELLLLTVVYLGLGYTTRANGHIVMDVLLMRMTPLRRAQFGTITSLVSAAISTFLTWYLVLEFWISFSQQWYTSTVVKVIIWPFYLMVAMGCFLMILEWIGKSVTNWREWRHLRRAA